MTNAHSITYRSNTSRRGQSRSASFGKTVALAFSSSENRVKMTRSLLFLSAILALFYAVNLYSIISNTVALQHINTSSRAITADVEALDTQYLALSSKITPDTLKAYGLEKGDVSYFIPRVSSLGRVSVGGHEL